MADFTLYVYTRLIKALIEKEYHFQTFRDYLAKPSARSIILRHDVDLRPQNSLVQARLEADLGLKVVAGIIKMTQFTEHICFLYYRNSIQETR